MAGRTLTATPWTGNIRDYHHSNYVSWDFNSGATKFGTASDVVLLAKIPHGVEILDCLCRYTTKADTQAIMRVELQDQSGTVLAVVVPTTTVSATGGQVALRAGAFSNIPYKVSLSDDAGLRYARLILNTLAGTETVSASLGGWVLYSRNSQP